MEKSDFAVLVLGFEKLGLELDNCGRTTKNAYCLICSLFWHLDIFTIDYGCEDRIKDGELRGKMGVIE